MISPEWMTCTERAEPDRLTVPGGNGQRGRPMIGSSFEAVLGAAAGGDEAAFGILWRDVQPGLLRYLDAFAPGAAEDLASETWLRIVQGLDRFRGDERAFRGWVFTVARHRAVDRWRRRVRRRDELVPADVLADLPAPDDPAGAAMDAISSRAGRPDRHPPARPGRGRAPPGGRRT